MSSPKPTLGFPTRTAAIEHLRTEGMTAAQIARKIGIDVKSVSALEASAARKRGIERPIRQAAPSTSKQHTVCIDNDVLRTLRPHAAKRGLSVNALARLLLATVADDNLVDALLDDGDA